MKWPFAAATVSLLGGLAGCGGSVNPSDETLTGTVAGTTFQVQSTVATIGPSSASCMEGVDGGMICTGTGGQVITIALTNISGLTCAYLEQVGANKPNADFLALELISEADSINPGTYSVGMSAGEAIVDFYTTSSTCSQQGDQTGTGGSVTLTTVSESHITGSFNVTFGTQGTFSGSFDVVPCVVSDPGVSESDGGPICQ